MLALLVGIALADELPEMLNANGNPIRWPRMPIDFKVDPANEGGLDTESATLAVSQGAGAWNDIADSGVKIRFMGTGSGFPVAHDEVNGVSFLADWPGDPDALAVTSVWSTGEGTAVGFDMQVNTADHAWGVDGAKDSADLQGAMAHEFGHVLGIGHLERSPEATMYPTAVDGETHKRDLTDDDRWIAMNFYPPVDDGPTERNSPFAALCATAGGPMSTLPVGAGMLVAALAARRRRPTAPCRPKPPRSTESA
jgi:hypothetical protein